MTLLAKDVIANLRHQRPQHAHAIFYSLADAALEARLRTGHSLCDLGDFSEWLRELGDAAREVELGSGSLRLSSFNNYTSVDGRRLLDPTCPRCGHVHQGERECGEEMGPGRICRCELSVPA